MAFMSRSRLTIFGRSVVLVLCEVLANAICWAVAGILFRDRTTRNNLGLALLSWTLGLRHGVLPLTDFLSAIDNATRTLINTGRLPITCGLFFSLGHSTIVIVVTVAIAISTDIYNRINGVGEVGSIVGAAVSGSFLFIVGLANSFILWRILRQRRRDRQRAKRIKRGEVVENEPTRQPGQDSMLMMRILGPIVTFVNRPWKMYPVGVLFGLESEGHSIPSSHVIILPLLFTAGMTLVDSLDSILMLYSYAGLLENPSRWRIIENKDMPTVLEEEETNRQTRSQPEEKDDTHDPEKTSGEPQAQVPEERIETETKAKMNVMSGLSIILTLMSIMVAFAISLITIMSLIGAHCSQCVAAAEAENGGGLAGAWWRGWADAGEHSGFIGVGIVGAVFILVAGWYASRWIARRLRQRRAARVAAQ
ncbi:NicO-domain-containing protein [Macrolepiota fuliginosa MF-IS2]|uniref:Nickel/cobalt efflux system n=1 Tax=Macrolepiota fuliginosa MF-IS2 TaxID=1400762 RepID=A0A9P5XLD3_9AGAR|nr:NicO-domain-containing protein [Macrolepiota fuliginosa MF-IS2]